MGFFSLINGMFKPSDDYMLDHMLEDYEPGDTANDDYDIDDDVEAMTMQRTCSHCGCSFTLDDAMSEYNSHFNFDLSYMSNYCGDICGDCAIEDTESQMENDEDDNTENEIPEGCAACGNPAFPNCTSSCPLYDE